MQSSPVQSRGNETNPASTRLLQVMPLHRVCVLFIASSSELNRSWVDCVHVYTSCYLMIQSDYSTVHVSTCVPLSLRVRYTLYRAMLITTTEERCGDMQLYSSCKSPSGNGGLVRASAFMLQVIASWFNVYEVSYCCVLCSNVPPSLQATSLFCKVTIC